MSDLMFHLVDGSPVFRGDELYVHPIFFQQAGDKVRAEFKTDFDLVTVRCIPSGAVPSLPISALSREPSPEAVVMIAVAKALCIQPYDVSKRDVRLWNAAMLASRPDTTWDDAVDPTKTAADYRELQAQHDQVQSRMKAAMDMLRDLRPSIVFEVADGEIGEDTVERIDALLAGQVPAQAVDAHPMQPILLDPDGRPRFKKNSAVEYLAEGRLNEIARRGYSDEDMTQLAQLIGYSVAGFGDLSYVSDADYERAVAAAPKPEAKL